MWASTRARRPSESRHEKMRRSLLRLIEKVQVALYDASAYFSEAEWKILLQWQKELYNNVMKEIHQALISLGPLIANTVSLRVKEKQDLCPMDTQDCSLAREIDGSPSNTVDLPDVLVINNEEEVPFKTDPEDTEGNEDKDCQSAGSSVLNNDPCGRAEDPCTILIDDLGAEVEASTVPNSAYPVVTAVFSLSINKDERREFAEKPAGRATADPVIRPENKFSPRDSRKRGAYASEAPRTRGSDIVSVLIKEEDDSMDQEESEQVEYVGTRTGAFSAAKSSASVAQISHIETRSRIPTRSLVGETCPQPESSFSKPEHFNVHLGRGKDAEFESELRNSEFDQYLSKEVENQQTMYTFNESDKSWGANEEIDEHAASPSRAMMTYPCPDCEKDFFDERDLLTHLRTHSLEKIFHCTFCPKSFNRKYSLDGHIRTHTGEKPYKCTDCDKEFNWKSGFIRHQRTHVSMNASSFTTT